MMKAMTKVIYDTDTFNDIHDEEDLVFAKFVIIDRIFQATRMLYPEIDDYRVIIENRKDDFGRILRGEDEHSNDFFMQIDVDSNGGLNLLSKVIGLFAAIVCHIKGCSSDRRKYKKVLDAISKNSISFELVSFERNK